MSRLRRSIGALLLTVLVCAGASAGPAFGDTPAAAGSSATAPAEAEPTTTAPVETSTTVPSGPTTTTGPTATTEPSTTDPSAPSARPGGPATTEPSPAFVDLTLTVAFDKPEFVADEPVTARARVTNVGTAPASRVTIDSPGNVEEERYWEEIGYYGVRVEPGQTVEATFVGRVTTTEYSASMVVTIRSLDEPDVNPADNVVAISAPVTVVRGTFAGTVYADRNGDATMNAGEALADLRVEVRGGRPSGSYTTKTDSVGRFLFRDLPRGNYEAWFSSSEVTFPRTAVRVDGEDDPDLLIRGALPVDSVLTASAALDRDAYRKGDTAHMTLTLTNAGALPIPGVKAGCWVTGAVRIDLGELADPGPGATLPPNATRAFDVQIPIVDVMAEEGYLRVGCSIGVHQGVATTEVAARIIGVVAPKVVGWVAVERSVSWPSTLGGPYPGAPVPNLKIYLKEWHTGAVLARATTNARGGFEFHDVPVGYYDVGVVGPWAIIFGKYLTVRSGAGLSHGVIVVPGPDQPDPDPQPAPQPGGPPAPTPPPGAGPAHKPPTAELAATGVNVTWLALGGLLTLLVGLGLVVRTGRGRT
ncbi:hypothetical protein AB0H12_38210 [Actinosynnema sp. NPDC023794]